MALTLASVTTPDSPIASECSTYYADNLGELYLELAGLVDLGVHLHLQSQHLERTALLLVVRAVGTPHRDLQLFCQLGYALDSFLVTSSNCLYFFFSR